MIFASSDSMFNECCHHPHRPCLVSRSAAQTQQWCNSTDRWWFLVIARFHFSEADSLQSFFYWTNYILKNYPKGLNVNTRRTGTAFQLHSLSVLIFILAWLSAALHRWKKNSGRCSHSACRNNIWMCVETVHTLHTLLHSHGRVCPKANPLWSVRVCVFHGDVPHAFPTRAFKTLFPSQPERFVSCWGGKLKSLKSSQWRSWARTVHLTQTAFGGAQLQ